ncbi:MAG TPA: FCD domain-containing protein, partial [Kofleriaceae bacterium]|nr:FCD domain-containing protein [Kofleriaceae bacterium]
AARREPADLERLRDVAQRAAVATGDTLFQLDFDFYIALTAASQNRVIGLLVNTVRESIQAYTAILGHVIVSPEVVRAHHRRLLAAIEAARPDDAVEAVDDYMLRGAEHVLALFERGRIGPVGAS